MDNSTASSSFALAEQGSSDYGWTFFAVGVRCIDSMQADYQTRKEDLESTYFIIPARCTFRSISYRATIAAGCSR